MRPKFHESIYSANAIELTEENLIAIRENVSCNHAVGFLAGHYDEKLSITKVSDYFLALLGFSYEEFMDRVDGSLLHAFYGENQSFLAADRFPLIHGSGEGMMVNSEDVPLHVNMYKSDSVNGEGDKIWLLSVRVDWNYENLHLVSGAMDGGMWYMNFDAAGKLTLMSVSHELRRMLGYHDILDMPNNIAYLFSTVHPADRSYVENRIRMVMEDKTGSMRYDVEYRTRRADGSYLWVRSKGEMTRRMDGTPYRMAGILMDIDEEKRLREKAQRIDAFHQAFTSANYSEYYVDLVGNSFDSLKGDRSLLAKEELCASWDDMVSAYVARRVHPEDRAVAKKLFDRAYIQKKFADGQKEINAEYRIYVDGELRWVRTVVFCDDHMDHLRHVIAYIRDVTETKEEAMKLAELHRENDAMALLLDGAAKTVRKFSTGDLEDGTYRIYSGCAEDEPSSGTIDSLIDRLSRLFHVVSTDIGFAEILSVSHLRKHLKGPKDIYRFEYCTKDESAFYMATLTPISWTVEGLLKNVLCMVEDVTKERTQEILSRQALEAAYAAAEKASRAKTDFLSNISHDIHTPMNAIMGMTALAESYIDDPKQVRKCLHKISRSSRYLLGLINEILDMTHIEGGEMRLAEEELRLPDLIDDVTDSVKPEMAAHGHHFLVHVRELHNEIVQGDAVRIKQMLLHLLSNAIKYTPDGGHILLTLRQLPHASGRGSYEFTVEDDGIGMSEEFQKVLFDPFTRADDRRTTQVPGTGLGMAIVKNIISLMGGHIHVHSAPGKGTRVTVTCTLPLVEDRLEEMKAKLVHPVLVVDDDVDCGENTVHLLSKIGVETCYVTTGEEALAHVESGETFSLIFLDWKTPGMNGLSTARLLRKLVGPDLPIILMTAYEYASIEEDALAAGITEITAKPFYRSRMMTLLSRVLKLSPPKPTACEVPKLSGKRILVVEDNALNSEIAVEILAITGAAIETAEDGKIAVDMVKSHPADWYDLVLMDIQMPNLNGYEATRAIRALPMPHIDKLPIVAMTANTFAEDAAKSKAAGMNEHLPKPLDLHRLYAVLRKFVK